MNIILFRDPSEAALLEPRDRRAVHVRKVLKLGPGEELAVGLVNGPRGRATIVSDDAHGLALDVRWDDEVEPPFPIALLVGLPRPQTARKVLRECTTLGVGHLDFFRADRGDRSYGQSKLWSTGEWERHLTLGAEQAFATSVPEVSHHRSLKAAMAAACARHEDARRIALDVYEGSSRLSGCPPTEGSVVLAIGPERGWSEVELSLLGAWRFDLFHLGTRVLRTETAAVAALTLILAKMGHM